MASLTTLPVELLLRVTEYLSNDRPSLLSFSRTCHLFSGIAIEDNYRDICLDLKDEATLAQDLNRLLTSIQGHERHVRQLRLTGCFQRAPPKLVVTVGASEHVYNPEQKKLRPKSRPIDWTDDAWTPLAEFIQGLPGLRDLIFACDNRVPACLLQLLHELRASYRCRLHVENFSLRTLTGGGDHLEGAYESALALASSPHLHSVTVSNDFYNRNRPRIGCNDEAVFAMFTGLAPSLKELRMLSMPGRVRISPDCWSIADFRLPQLQDRKSKPSGLTSLSTSGKFIPDFKPHANFSSLTRLDVTEVNFMNELVELQTFNLQSLKSLSMNLNPEFSDQEEEPWDRTVSSFLRSLEPLESLVLEGQFRWDTVNIILERHGRKLRKLRFERIPHRCRSGDMHFTLKQVTKLRNLCPHLTELSLPIARTDGDATEVAIYRELGSLPRLQDLSLDLICTDEFDRRQSGYIECSSQRAENVDLETLFKRCAVDEALARSIVQTIRGVRTRAGHISALKNVELSVNYPQLDRELLEFEIGVDSLTADTVSRALSIPWVATKSIRDDCDEFTYRIGEKYQPPDILDVSNGYTLSVFRKIWPYWSNHWSRDWYSFPLATGAVENSGLEYTAKGKFEAHVGAPNTTWPVQKVSSRHRAPIADTTMLVNNFLRSSLR